MAKITLTLEDNPDGTVRIKWDHGITEKHGGKPATLAHMIANDLNIHLDRHAEYAREDEQS